MHPSRSSMILLTAKRQLGGLNVPPYHAKKRGRSVVTLPKTLVFSSFAILLLSGCTNIDTDELKKTELTNISVHAPMGADTDLVVNSTHATADRRFSAVPVTEHKAAPAYSLIYSRKFQRIVDSSYADYSALLAADFTGDGRTDLVARSNSNEIELYVQQLGGGLADALIYRFASNSTTRRPYMVVNDFNEDGISDVAYEIVTDSPTGSPAVGGIGVMLSHKDVLPTHIVGYPGASGTQHFTDWVTLDVDGDGHQDIVRLYNIAKQPGLTDCIGRESCPRYEVYHGDGSGKFGRMNTVAIGVPYGITTIEARDLNEDGVPDLAMYMVPDAFSNDPYAIMVSYRLPHGGLAPAALLHTLGEWRGGCTLAFADVSGDGIDDTVCGWLVWLRSVNGIYAPPYSLSTYNGNPGWPAIADFDGDGKNDLISSQFMGFGSANFLAMYLQRNGGFVGLPIVVAQPANTYGGATSTDKHAFAPGDFNNDGCIDLAAAVSSDGIAIFIGQNCTQRKHIAPDESGYVWRRM